MRAVASVLGALLVAASVAACGGDSYEPGEEVWIDLKGDRAIHQGYALAIVIDQRKDLVEIQVNALDGGQGDEYLPVLRKGRGYVPVRMVQSRRDGLQDARRKRETIATYLDMLARDVARPMRVSDKAAERAGQYRFDEIVLAFALHRIYTDGVLDDEDKVDGERARARAAEMLTAMKMRLDQATRGTTDRDVLAAVAAALKLPPASRGTSPHAALAHGQRLGRGLLALTLEGRERLTDVSLAAAEAMRAGIDAFVAFAWRYDPEIRRVLRGLKTPDVAAARVQARQYFFKDTLARLRETLLDRAAAGLTLPLTEAQVDAKFAEARAAAAKISDRLRLEVVPANARAAFGEALEARVRKRAEEARKAYISANAHSLVLAGGWVGTATCPAGDGAAAFPFGLDLRIELDLESEGLGVFRGSLGAVATAAPDDGALAVARRFLPGGRLPGEGTARATLRIRVDTETGEVRWMRIMRWSAGPPLLQGRVDAARGHLDWSRPVAFSIEVCGTRMAMRRSAAGPPTR